MPYSAFFEGRRSLGSRRLKCSGFGLQHLWFCYSAAVIHENGAGHERRIVTGQVHANASHFLRFDQPTQGQVSSEERCYAIEIGMGTRKLVMENYSKK